MLKRKARAFLFVFVGVWSFTILRLRLRGWRNKDLFNTFEIINHWTVEKYKQIQHFIEELEVLVNQISDLHLILSTYTQQDGTFKMLDAILVRDNEALAIFEFKAGLIDIPNKLFYETYVPSNINFKFLILSNGSFHNVLNRFSSETKEFKNTSELLNYLIKIPSDKEIEKTKGKIAAEIEKATKEYFKYISNDKKNMRF